MEQLGERRLGLTVVACSDREQNLADIHTSHGSVGLSPRTPHSSLQPIGASARQHFVDANNMVRMGAYSEMEPFFSSDFDQVSRSMRQKWIRDTEKEKVPYLLAQIRAASRASEDSCSYSLETMWTQRGNSSTLARFRPKSKIRILGSGTPRLKRDLG